MQAGIGLFIVLAGWISWLSPQAPEGTALSLLPPLATIFVAFLTREVLSALVMGAFLGCLLKSHGDMFTAYTEILQYFVDGLKDADKVKIMAFSIGLGGLISFCNRNGGTAGIVRLFTRFARTRAQTQLSTWALGLCIFFDDYASSLVTGSTMRPMMDRMKVSREKLAYIVDATSAPIACVAPISTWIANQLGLFAAQLAVFPALAAYFNSYGLFLAALPYSFYAFFCVALMFLLAFSGREAGPMLEAERDTQIRTPMERYGEREEAKLEGEGAGERPGKAWFAMLPIFTVLSLTLGTLYSTGTEVVGSEAPLRDIISNGATGTALLRGAYGGCFLAFALGLWDRRYKLNQAPGIFLTGGRAMVDAVLVLTLAWLMGRVCQEVQTAVYVSHFVSANVKLELIPALVFLVSGLVAFATGTSWGTMGIMIPIVLGLTPLHDPSMHAILLPAVAAILAGASLGDHCSPISDTTVLSSLASGVDVLAHVKTQLPYALLVGAACTVAYAIPPLMGVSGAWPGILLGLGIVTGFVFLIAEPVKKKEEEVQVVEQT